MKKSLICLSLLLAFGPSAQASGGVVYCTNCGNEGTQYMNYAQLYSQTQNMIQQLQILQQQAARLTTGIPYSQTAGLLTKLFQTVNQGQALGYTLANIEKQFQLQYPQFGKTHGDYFDNYTNWSNTTQDSIRAALNAAGVQSDNFATEEATAETLRMLNASPAGQLQAIQIGNAVSSEMLDEMRKLRQLQMSQNQAHNAFLLSQQQQEIDKTTAMKKYIEGGRKTVRPYSEILKEYK